VAIDLSDGSLVLVPRVEGRSAASADALLVQASLRPEPSTQASSAAPDSVIAQDPAAGTTVARASTVRIVVAIAPPIAVPQVVGPPIPPAPPPLPDFTGKDIDEVRRDPRNASVALGDAQRVFDPAKSGTILRQSVAPDTRPAPGTVLTFVVSRGPLWPWVVTSIAAVTALLVAAAAAALWPPFRYRVLVKNHKVSASSDSLELDGPPIEMRVHVEHGKPTLNEDP
jgi:beta-lactam-binding protein with PASTA domain